MEIKKLHQIIVRRPNAEEKETPNPQFPDYGEETFQSKLDSLVEDIQAQPDVAKVFWNDSPVDNTTEGLVSINVESELDKETLLIRLKPLFISCFDYIKYVEIL
jgi:hypothetical protein